MDKNNKIVICRNCKNPISVNAKVCLACGLKNKKPFYKKAWFIILAIIVFLCVIKTVSGSREKIDRSEMKLGSVLPETPSNKGSLYENAETIKPEDDTKSEHNESIQLEDDIKPENTENDMNEIGLSPDFKAAMDSYEEFMDSYVTFMKKCNDNSSDLGLLADYAKFMNDYTNFVKDFEKWGEADLNPEEAKYYIGVQLRVAQKLLEIAK